MTGYEIRPVRRLDSDGAYASADGRWTFLRHETDPYPKRWFAYLDGDDFPSNSGEGHTTLREAGEWARDRPVTAQPVAPRERAWEVEQAVASGRLEGVEPSSEFLADAAEYVDGVIDAAEMVARARRRWGLE